MAWTPISGTMTQYHTSANLLAANYYLKFYQDGTTTPFNMATDSGGGTTLDKCQLDASGYPTTDGTTRFIPHVDQTYKIALYQNATDADNNTTGSADWVIDGVTQPAVTGDIPTNPATLASSVTYTPSGTGAVNTDVQTKLREFVNIKDFGAVGDGATDDNTAFVNFIAECVASGRKGYIPSGEYLINPFTFSATHAGLVLEGDTCSRTASGSFGSGPGLFGLDQTVLVNQTTSTNFITIDGAYDIDFTRVSLNGNKTSDNVLYYPGTNNNTHTFWSHSEFCGATVTTGVIHRYDGSIGGEHCTFEECYLFASHNRQGPDIVDACIYNTNTNAFLGTYNRCVFGDSNYSARFNVGAANLYDCMFFNYVTAGIAIDSICKPFVCTTPYTEATVGIPFFKQFGSASVQSARPILIINPSINSVGGDIILNHQQPVHIYGGFIGGGVSLIPKATVGTHTNIIDGLNMESPYGLTGAGVETQTIYRGVAIDFAPITDSNLNTNFRGTLFFGKSLLTDTSTYNSNNEGATPDVQDKYFINLSNGAAQNITDLSNGTVGQTVILNFQDANSTLIESSSLALNGTTNFNPTAGSTVTLMKVNVGQWKEVARMTR